MAKKAKKDKSPLSERELSRDIQKVVKDLADHLNVNVQEAEAKILDAFEDDEEFDLSVAMAKIHSELDYVMCNVINEAIHRYADEENEDRSETFKQVNSGHVLHSFITSLCVQIFLRATDKQMGIDLIENSITKDSLNEAYKIAKALEENLIIEKDNSHEGLKNLQDQEGQRHLADEINRAFDDAEPTIH
tara:strand:+ start:252 stop:821 length:570 start_codon:yes stop_codon:yes gene_type:complete